MEEDVRESLPLQKNILKIGYRKKEKLKEDHQKDPKADHWADGETSTWEEFLTSTWCRNFHLLVRRILKKDETLGLPDEQETALFETTSAGLHNWKNLAETIYNANLDRILVTDEIGYGIVPIDPFEPGIQGRNRPHLLSAGRKVRGSLAGLLWDWNAVKVGRKRCNLLYFNVKPRQIPLLVAQCMNSNNAKWYKRNERIVTWNGYNCGSFMGWPF